MKPILHNQAPSTKLAAYMLIALGITLIIMDAFLFLISFMPPLTWTDLVAFGIGLFIFIIVLFLAIGFFFIGMGRYLLRYARTLGRRETKRRRIMQGQGTHLLAQTQPLQAAITLPLSVRLRAPVRLKIFAIILTLIELGALFIILILAETRFALLISLFIDILLVLFISFIAFGSTQWIIDDKGITYKIPLGTFYSMQ